MAKDQFIKFPSRIPPQFVGTVVRSLLPPVDIASLTGPALLAFQKKAGELRDLVTNDPVRFFKPSPGGQYDFLTCNDANIQGLYFFAGNKAGKTTGAAILIAENACGSPLWGRDKRTIHDLLLRGRTPIRICAFCEDFSTHEETIVPTILSWVPRRLLAPKPIERGPSGNIVKMLFASGTHIFFRTYDQGYEKAEGKDYDLVWCDEPPKRDIYTAIWRGLVATKGRIVIAATLLSEVWLYDELVNPFVKTFEATMYDNQWLDAAGRANFEALLDEEERNIRILGKPSSLTGKIYPSFREAAPYVIPTTQRCWNPFTEEPYPIIAGVDPHERKPLHIAWAWVTPHNRIIWFDWDLVPAGRLSDMFARIAAKEKLHTGSTQLVIMDPNRGRAKQIDGRSWEEEFLEHEYEVVLGIDDVNFGHSELREMLGSKIEEDGTVTISPMMQWMDCCMGKNGPTYQMSRYTWDDYSRNLRSQRTLKEKPKQLYKDFPDIFRYVACAHVEYSMLIGGNHQVLNLNGRKPNQRAYA